MNKQIAIHEAGHAVVAHALGIGGLHIKQTEHGYACGMEVPEEPDPLSEWVLAVVSAAGAAAEQAFGMEPGDGGDLDWSYVCEHVAAWAELEEVPEDDDEFEAKLRRVCDTACAIVLHRRSDISELADRVLAAGGQLTELEVLAVLEPR